MEGDNNKHDLPLFSIIITVYNVEKYLEECVCSFLFQEFQDFEIILINDGSFDDSGNLCDKFVSQYSQISVIHKENSGTASARNAGIKIAKGAYLWFVDGDDLVVKDSLAVLNNLLNYCENITVCNFNRIEFVDGELYHQPFNSFDETKSKITVYDNKSEHIPSSVCYSLFKKEFILNIGIAFNENNQYEDEFFNLELYTNFSFKILNVDYPLYFYRRKRLNSKTNSLDAASLFLNCVSVIDLFDYVGKINLDSYNKKTISYKKKGYAEVGLFLLICYLRKKESLKKVQLLKLFRNKINQIPIDGRLLKRNQIPRLLYNLNKKIFLFYIKVFDF